MLTLYDAPRCPYCARARIVLAEKEIPHEVVTVDLEHRPQFIVDLNPPHGRVPVIEEGAFLLPESAAILEYLEERFPEPALLPDDPAARAAVRLAVVRFSTLSDPYYDLYFRRPSGSIDRLEEVLGELDQRLDGMPYLAGEDYSLADISYVPWILRAESRLGVDLAPFSALSAWRDRLLERPAIAAEAEVVATL